MKTFIAEFKLPDGRIKFMGFWADNKALAVDHATTVAGHNLSFIPNAVRPAKVVKVTMVAKADFDDAAAGVMVDSWHACIKKWIVR